MEKASIRNKYKLYQYKTRDSLVDDLSQRIVDDLKNAIKRDGCAYMALSGGSTPKKLFEKLSTVDLQWSKVVITLVDERWVANYQENSNEKLINDYLLKNKAKSASFIPLKNVVCNAKDGIDITRHRLKKIKNLDIVVLGMGEDAHTASFFPHAMELEKALTTKELCCATTASVEPYERVTLSRDFLLKTQNLILHIEGQKKKDVFDMACGNDDMQEMPIISMMQQDKPLLEVYYA